MAYHPRTAFIGQALPPLIRRESLADMLAARRASYLAANPEWIDDPSDPAAEVISAVADLEFRAMMRYNTGAVQLSAATADGQNLDALAGNVGLARADQEADAALRQRIAAHQLAANIATMPALLAACLSRPGIADAYAPQPVNGQDFVVQVRASENDRKELEAWLRDDVRALAGWNYDVEIATETRIYAAVVITYNSTNTPIGDLRPAVEAAVHAYFASLGINQAAHINRITSAAITAGAQNAVATIGLSAGALTGADLPALPKGYYHVDDPDADIVWVWTDVI